MKLKSNKKLGLLTQALLASSVMLMPITNAIAAVQPLAGAGNVNNGSVVQYTGIAGQVVKLQAANVFGLPDAADIAGGYPAGFSMITTTANQGVLEFEGNVAPATVISPGSLGQAAAPLELMDFKATGNNQGGIIGGNVTAADIQFSGNKIGLFTIQGNTTVPGTIDFNVAINNILTFDNTKNNITITTPSIENAGNAGNGTLAFAGNNTTTLTGGIGVGGALAAVNVNAGTVNVAGTIEANVTLNKAGILNQSGDITGVVTLNNTSTLNQGADITGNTTLADTATLNVVGGDRTITGALNGGAAASTINVNSNKLTVTANSAINALNTLAVQTSDAVFAGLGVLNGTGHIDAGVANIANNAAALLRVTPIGYIGNGTNITLTHGAAGVNVILVQNISGQSAVLALTTTANAATDLNLTVVRTPYTSPTLSLNSQSPGIGGALESDGAAGRLAGQNSTMELAVGAIDRLQTAREVNNALNQLAPNTDGAIAKTAQVFTDETIGTIGDRLMMVALNDTGTYNTGMSAGDTSAEGWGVWGQVFGSKFKQKERNNVLGYDGDTVGLSLGTDWKVDDASILGLAVSYSHSTADQDLASSRLKTDSIQGTLYSSFKCRTSPWYAQGLLGIAHHDYKQDRNITIVGAPNGTAHGDFSAWEGIANGEIGYIYHENEWNLIPSGSLKYTHLKIKDYLETGGGGYNLNVHSNNINAFVAGLGMKAQYLTMSGGNKVVPEVHANVFYDFIGKAQQTNSNLFGTGTSFNTVGPKPAKTSYELGVGLNIHSNNNSTFSINYDYDFQEDFHAHSGFVKLRYQW